MAVTYEAIQGIVARIREQWNKQAQSAILLGTGLGALADRITVEARIQYADLPQMPVSSAESHAGELICGQLGGQNIIGFSGRLHCYEGHSPAEVVAPIRVAQLMGVQQLVMASAAGGLNPFYSVGDIVLISDHINLMGVNPLVGPNDERFGPRWPDMIEPYDHGLQDIARAVALQQAVKLQDGVYAAVLGPNLETRAEYRMLQRLGADLVGMSTVPETVAAVHAGIKTLAFGIVTDMCLPDALEAADVAKIIAAANGAEPQLSEIIIECLQRTSAE